MNRLTPYGTVYKAIPTTATSVYTAGVTSSKVSVITISNPTGAAITPTISILTKSGVTMPISKPGAIAAAAVASIEIPFCLSAGDSISTTATAAGLDVMVSVEALDYN